MPSKYPKEQRERAISYWEDGCSVAEVTALMDIPQRTLRRWRQRWVEQKLKEREERSQNLTKWPEKFSDGRSSGHLDEEPPELAEQLQRLRDQIMKHIFILSQSLSVDDERINERAIALTRLIDRVLTLEKAIQQSGIYKKDQVIRFEYKYPDGTIHDVPPWTGTYNDEDHDPEFGRPWLGTDNDLGYTPGLQPKVSPNEIVSEEGEGNIWG